MKHAYYKRNKYPWKSTQAEILENTSSSLKKKSYVALWPREDEVSLFPVHGLHISGCFNAILSHFSLFCFLISFRILKYPALFSTSLLNVPCDFILAAASCLWRGTHSPSQSLFLFAFFFMACTTRGQLMMYLIASCLCPRLKWEFQQDTALPGSRHRIFGTQNALWHIIGIQQIFVVQMDGFNQSPPQTF